jgi:hypothetical protein
MTNRRRLMQVMFSGAAAIAVLALFEAAQLGTGQTTVASGSVRLVDQDLPAPPPPAPPSPGFVLPPETVLPPGVTVLPGGLPLPPLPPGYVLSPDMMQILTTEAPQMLAQGQAMLAAGPPPNVPNEVCRYNTIRIPCPQ